ncbi:hypothetical protein B0H10DRAFT_2233987 [Mycena sp. CBHHK59/15]|nr:hypothetical protein B0H10DRAFT_2233987 [Mycena sp. CBHHK59/15]
MGLFVPWPPAVRIPDAPSFWIQPGAEDAPRGKDAGVPIHGCGAVIFSLDYKRAGHIVDAEMHAMVVPSYRSSGYPSDTN